MFQLKPTPNFDTQFIKKEKKNTLHQQPHNNHSIFMNIIIINSTKLSSPGCVLRLIECCRERTQCCEIRRRIRRRCPLHHARHTMASGGLLWRFRLATISASRSQNSDLTNGRASRGDKTNTFRCFMHNF